MGVPSNIIVPFVGVSFDASRASQGPAGLEITACLIGQKLAAGSATPGTLYLIATAEDAIGLTGVGSQLHRMAQKWFASNKYTPVYLNPLADDGTATAATVAIPLSGTATASGEFDLYIDMIRVAVGVASGTLAADLGASLVAAINADTSMPCTASFGTGTLTLTAKNKGIAAGDFTVVLNYNSGEKTPSGLTVGTIAATAGTVDPDVAGALTAIGDHWFQILVGPYTDATNLTKIEAYLEDNAGPMIQHDGTYISAKKDTLANLVTFGAGSTRNCPWVAIYAATGCPEATTLVAVAIAAKTAESVQNDPAVPLHRMALDLYPAPASGRFILSERNTLARSGIATISHDNGVQTEATVTMYLKNSAGAPDTAYQQQNRVFILQLLRFRFVARILQKYPRAKLADSAERVRSGQQIITPDIGKAEAVAWFLEAEADGLVEGIAQFKADLVCRRSTSNLDRLEWILPPDLINAFIVGSADLQFRV